MMYLRVFNSFSSESPATLVETFTSLERANLALTSPGRCARAQGVDDDRYLQICVTVTVDLRRQPKQPPVAQLVQKFTQLPQ